MSAIKIMLAILTTLLLSFFHSKINRNRKSRIYQLPFVLFSLIYLLSSLIFAPRYLSYFNNFAEQQSFFSDGGLFLLNTAILSSYLIARLIMFPISSLLSTIDKFVEFCALNLFDYDSYYDGWFLQDRWVNYRKFLHLLTISLNVIIGLYLGLTWTLGQKSFLWILFLPSAVILVVNEFFNYINAETVEEYKNNCGGEDSTAYRISNYYKIREVFERLFPESVLSAHTGCEYMAKEGITDYLEKLDVKNNKEQMLKDYFSKKSRYMNAETDGIRATSKLLDKENVIFYNPFYKDLGIYVTLPFINSLLSGKKCLVLCGRRSIAPGLKVWLNELMTDWVHLKTMWRIEELGNKEKQCEIGIVTFSQIYDKDFMKSNSEFFKNVDFVFMIEPSIILNTSQVAINILAEKMQENGNTPYYCICDRYTDGLVDTLSHVLHIELVNVVAMPVPRCSYSGMTWNVDSDFYRQQLFDKQTRYLGAGTELAAVAVKNQIPNVTWYSDKKTPLKDVKWIVGQYYTTLCRYMNIPCQQNKLYEKIKFISNLWEAKSSDEEFIIVEDEFNNMFTMMRTFLSRGKKQAFVNILSENYLLRDYMRCNQLMFMSNPNAIPSYVPDYAKTERNTLLKLLLMMSLRPVREEEIVKELHLIGNDYKEPHKELNKLLKKYTFTSKDIFKINEVKDIKDDFSVSTIYLYTISDTDFDACFSKSLKNAYYILEEENEEGYLDSKLFSHVTQTILPGQLVTYNGKYYIAKYMTPKTGVVLRRASELYTCRKYYRQIRHYTLEDKGEDVVSTKIISDFEFTEIRGLFRVETKGYLEMLDNCDLRSAKVIDLTSDPLADNYNRMYKNKTYLRIKLPNSSVNIRFTLCLLISEIFKSIFPDGWQYVAVVTKRPNTTEGFLNYLVYDLDGDIEDDYIYIFEDSDLDLGILNTIERNFAKILEIIADFSSWHFDKMREGVEADPPPKKIILKDIEKSKKRKKVNKLLDRIRKIFGVEKIEEVKIEDINTDISTSNNLDSEDSKNNIETNTKDENENNTNLNQKGDPNTNDTDSENKKVASLEMTSTDGLLDDPDLIEIDGTDIFDNEGLPEDLEYLESKFDELGLTPISLTKYQRECFLKFGFEEIDSRICVEDVRKYLRVRGWCNNSLTLARKREVMEKTQLDLQSVNTCDFCGLPISGVSYERLNDGRIRCNDCSNSAINGVTQFTELFNRMLDMMKNFYSIEMRIPIAVKITDARTIAKASNLVFKPSKERAPRILGFAQLRKGHYSIFIENGSPRLATIDTMIHELTHIWQYLHWDDNQIYSIYAMDSRYKTKIARDMLYEGMAVWSAIQFLYLIGESYYASQQELVMESRKDIYGVGFKLYAEQYPLVKGSSLLSYSPFLNFPTLDPHSVKEEIDKLMNS